MSIFSRIKTKKNDKVSYYKFPAKSFTSEKIANLCIETQVDGFLIEIYGLSQNDITATKTKIFDDSIDVIINPNQKEKRLVVGVPVLKMQNFLTYITGFDFDEILIWDRYTTIDHFVQKGQSISNKKSEESKFFLDYNKYGNRYAELYLAPTIDSQSIQKILSE